MKIRILCLVTMCIMASLGYGQEAEKFRVDLRLGYTTGDAGDGILINLEPKWSIDEKINVGFRIAGAGLVTIGDENDLTISGSDRIAGIGSYTGTVDYYVYHKPGSPFAVFTGAGLGYYGVLNYTEDLDDEAVDNLETNGGFGGFGRVGFDYFKFRVALEYNLAPKGTLRGPGNIVLGEVNNNYLGLSLGFYFGGGKWKRVDGDRG